MKRRGLILIAILIMAFPVFSQVINVPAELSTIQEAINAAVDGDTVLVAEGTYIENINYRGKAITVASQFLLDNDTSHISKTIIDGSEPVYPDSGSTVTMLLARDTTSVLCGFTIQGGTGTGPFEFILGGRTTRMGGGIISAGGKIINNRVHNNQVNHTELASGGGIAAGENTNIESDTGVNLVIRNNLIFHNSIHSDTHYSSGGGLGVELNSRYTLVENNEIYENTSISDATYKAMGGGLHLGRLTSSTGMAIIRNNYIHLNEIHSELSFGGGIFYLLLYDSPISTFHPTEIYNNVIANNHSDSHGGGICVWYIGVWDYKPPVEPVFINNTIVNNYAEKGSGICNIDTDIALINNILWNNMPNEGGTEIFDEQFKYCAPSPAWCIDKNKAIIRTAYNNIRGGRLGDVNIGFDPYFEEGTYQLSDSSACVGRGIDSIQISGVWYHAPSIDYEGKSRPNVIDPNIDIGVYESAYETKLLSVADLSYIGFNNELFLPDFHKDSLLYELFVPDTISSPIPLQVVPLDMFSFVDIDYPSNLKSENKTERTATITVSSSDSTIQKTYSVLFQLLSTDATLSDLTLAQGTLSPEFDPEITSYEATLPAGTTEAPAITCSTSDEQATFKIFNAYKVTSSLENFRTSKVTVTSEYGEPFLTAYKILFNIETVGIVGFAKDSKVKIYPNPTNSLFTIETEQPDHYSIDITSLNGQQLLIGEMVGTSQQIDLSSFQKGVYFITIRSKDFVTTRKVIKIL